MEPIRVRKIASDRRELEVSRFDAVNNAYCAWRLEHATTPILPRAVDFAWYDDIEALIMASDDVVVDDAALAPIVALFPRWVKDWQDIVRDTLQASVMDMSTFTKHIGTLPKGVDPLTLAATVFRCNRCSRFRAPRPLRFPQSTVHCCAWQRIEAYMPRCEDGDNHVLEIAQQSSLCKEWIPDMVRLDTMFTRAVTIVKACGQDPACTTADDMDALDVRLSCDRCESSVEVGRKAINWRAAVRWISQCL